MATLCSRPTPKSPDEVHGPADIPGPEQDGVVTANTHKVHFGSPIPLVILAVLGMAYPARQYRDTHRSQVRTETCLRRGISKKKRELLLTVMS